MQFALREILLCLLSLSRGRVNVKIATTKSVGFIVLEISTKESGIGIPLEDKKHLFDPAFFLPATRGSIHMSLRQAHEIVSRQGGRMEEVGNGLDNIKFKVILPKHEK